MASLPHFPVFNVHSEEQSAGIRWKKWINRFENMLCTMDVESDKKKKAMLLHYIGDEAYDIYDSFTDIQKGVGAVKRTEDGETPDEYGAMKKAFTEYFTPKHNTSYEVFKFRQTTQNEGESMDSFHTRLRSLAATCDFHDIDREILSQILQGCLSPSIRRKALKNDMTLANLLAEARASELSDARAAEIEQACNNSASSVNAVKRGSQHQHDTRKHHTTRQHQGETNYSDRHQPSRRDKGGFNDHRGSWRQPKSSNSDHRQRCRYCGGNFPHINRCPARGKECTACHKIGHFAKVCESTGRVRQLEFTSQDEQEDSTSSEGEVFTLTSQRKRTPMVSANIFQTPVNFLVDTGATVNIINTDTFKEVCPKITLHHPSPLIYPYGSKTPLTVEGHFKTKLTFKNVSRIATFYVVDINQTKAVNILSGTTAEAMNMIQFAFTANTTKPNPVAEKYNHLFDDELGKIKDIRIKLHIDETVTPVAQRHRRIPFHVRKDVEKELDRLEAMDVIEKVDGPTPWISPIVVVPKKSGGVRVCIDMREANQAIKREKHPMPTLDDLISDLNGSTVFSKLDMKNAYHQLELHESSRYITTFTTHAGLRRYKRLLFGVNAASEIFQNVIAELLHDIPGVKNLSDDIIVHGKTQAEHDRSLNATLQRLSEKGAKLQKEKCVFSVPELTFFGHVFGKEGIKPDPEKIKTISESPAPTNISEVRSFLGMTQYVSRFIPGYATLTEPLRLLTQKKTTWKWGQEQEHAFNKLKQCLVGAKVMAYFDPTKHSTILVDASPVGLGAILTQEGRVISYASRALTATEQRYSQTEREMLAVVYGVEHFHLYLFGAPVTVLTDHKPLLGMTKSQKPATARVDRWRLRLMPYNIDLRYSPGRDDLNPADFISRHPQTVPLRDNAGEDYVRYVAKHSVPKSMTQAEVRSATQDDETLQRVMTAIQSGRWQDNNISEYAKFSDELSAQDGLILRGHRLVIPACLQQRVIDIAHQSHQGIVKTKQCIREKVWFPGIDRLVEQTIKACIPCQASYPGPKHREPIIPTPLPSQPWSSLAIDFAGPFPSGEYLLVVIDEHSRFPEVEIVSSTSAAVVLPRLETIFSRQGIPQIIKTDNGPPFNGHEFKAFANKFGFHHRKITPLWPEANGTIERFMASVNKNVRASTAAGLNWKKELQPFLRMYRATPHACTGISPFEALTGRKMNFGLPQAPYTPTRSQPQTLIAQTDERRKLRMKTYADQQRRTRPSTLQPGDQVLVRQAKQTKLTTPYSSQPFIVTEKKGSMITAQRGNNIIVRNSSHFKPINITEEKETSTPARHVTTRTPNRQPHSQAQTPEASSPRSGSPDPASPPSTPNVPELEFPELNESEPPHPLSTPGAPESTYTRPHRARRPPAYLKDYEQ